MLTQICQLGEAYCNRVASTFQGSMSLVSSLFFRWTINFQTICMKTALRSPGSCCSQSWDSAFANPGQGGPLSPGSQKQFNVSIQLLHS